jgi:major vault protein
VGDELFLTGREQMIYFPRPEHAVVKYSDQEIHYALAIPAGEGRYVLDRNSGQITPAAKGPSIFLPDPRTRGHRAPRARRRAPSAVVPRQRPEALAVNQRLSGAQA